MEFQTQDQFRDLLRRTFPNIYQNDSEILTELGWNQIIYQLSENIDKTGLSIYVAQVKEKFAGLRFYYSPHNPIIDQLINEAKDKASLTCQKCGSPGTLCDRYGWESILCESHIKEPF